jgi:hypothetical protein
MNPAFAGPDFGEEEDSQLTLGTTSLLSIFFGLVMICGIFFGLGYTVGRRSFAQLVMQKQPPVSVPVRKVVAPPVTAATNKQTALPPQTNSVTTTASIQPTAPGKVPATVASPAMTPAKLTIASSPATIQTPAIMPGGASSKPQPSPTLKSNVAAASAPSPANNATTKPPVPVATLLANKTFLPKPSAIQPVLIQPRTNVAYLHGVPMPPNPYEAAQLPWKWTPPFDVHPATTHSRLYRPHEARLNPPSAAHAAGMQTNSAALDETRSISSTHAAFVIQVAAMSRQDDAQVLADTLRKRGFVASIQNGNEDTLYHVQVGPLERRVALATQQRLIARGYNAVVK